MNRHAAVLILIALTACQRLENVGKAPAFTPVEAGSRVFRHVRGGLPDEVARASAPAPASLWSGGRGSLLGDRRAEQRGDILTVVIEIDDKAEISNSTGRSRSGSESMRIPALSAFRSGSTGFCRPARTWPTRYRRIPHRVFKATARYRAMKN